MRPGLFDVVRRQAPIEPDRGVQGPEDTGLGLGETRHAGIMPSMPPIVRPARPTHEEAPELLYLSAAPYYDAFAGSPERARRLLAAIWPKPGHTASWDSTRV